MSAPALSPAEQAEVDRFGAHDEEILAHLEERGDEEIGCQVARCEETATHVLVCEYCGKQAGLVCGTCSTRIGNSLTRVEHTPCHAVDMVCLLLRSVPL